MLIVSKVIRSLILAREFYKYSWRTENRVRRAEVIIFDILYVIIKVYPKLYLMCEIKN